MGAAVRWHFLCVQWGNGRGALAEASESHVRNGKTVHIERVAVIAAVATCIVVCKNLA